MILLLLISVVNALCCSSCPLQSNAHFHSGGDYIICKALIRVPHLKNSRHGVAFVSLS